MNDDGLGHRIFSERAIRRARLGSGLVIFIFVLLHLSNHAIGLISVTAADKAAHLFLAIWRNPLGTAIFYSSVLIHIALVLRAIYMRRSLVMPKGEMAQIVLGLMIPLLLMDHVIGTRIAHEFYGYIDDYETVISTLWIRNPTNGVRQVFGVVAVWIHGCIGIHFWLRYRPGIRTLRRCCWRLRSLCRCSRCSASSKWAGRLPIPPTRRQ